MQDSLLKIYFKKFVYKYWPLGDEKIVFLVILMSRTKHEVFIEALKIFFVLKKMYVV